MAWEDEENRSRKESKIIFKKKSKSKSCIDPSSREDFFITCEKAKKRGEREGKSADSTH